jgi:hypothetical protein
MTSEHPVIAAWAAAGRPEPNWQGKARSARTAPTTTDGICALTSTRGAVVPITACVSDSFTAWDRLRHLDCPHVGFSRPAAWAFRERIAMQRPHGLVDGAWSIFADGPDLLAALTRFDPHRDLLLVPQSRQKHLLPWVTWGTVRVDDETLAWGEHERHLLGVYARLRDLGFGPIAITEPTPRFQLLRNLDGPTRADVLAMWPTLDRWRAHTAYLDVAAIATRRPRPAQGDADV